MDIGLWFRPLHFLSIATALCPMTLASLGPVCPMTLASLGPVCMQILLLYAKILHSLV